jgi:hypothetical protein
MAMKGEFESIEEFSDWYTETQLDRNGGLWANGFTDRARKLRKLYDDYRHEMNSRVRTYEKYEKQAAAEVVSKKADLPNISSGESAGYVRRIARNVVQHTPNVFINNEFDDDSIYGHMARYILKAKIIGDDEYSNDMQQNLVTTARRGLTIGFDCVVPILLQDARKSWYIQYDNIHYRDVFPEPGAKDIRRATNVFVRRYMTRGDLAHVLRNQVEGWDHAAVRSVLGTQPLQREYVDHESKKHSVNTDAYEIITWYSNTGDAFLTFEAKSGLLLRIEKNKHPMKEHPVFFFIPERDDTQPFGKSMLSLTFGRQEFQDLFLNGSMKMWYRNINPPIIGYGVVNGAVNLSPGKYNEIQNPNARIEPMEVNTQALMMFGTISQQNAANMQQMMGAADQQMAAQSTGGMMSQTPAGVEAQQAMVDITTNNYQKAMEAFFSKYCSYALTIYFQELKSTTHVTPTADVRGYLINEGVPPEAFIHEEHYVQDEDGNQQLVNADGTGLKDGQLAISFADMATVYYVQTVPGSLVELEDEKQTRLLNEMFIPLSQAMPALAQTGDQRVLSRAAKAMEHIIKKQLELTGSKHSAEINAIFSGEDEEQMALTSRVEQVEALLTGEDSELLNENTAMVALMARQQEQIRVLTEGMTTILAALPRPAGAGGPAPGPAAAPGPQGTAPASAPQSA